jgi:hypothetical protein
MQNTSTSPSRYTLGPLHAVDDGAWHVSVEEEWDNVADVVGESDAEAEAYAHLFAAAPQLLSACKAALDEVEQHECVGRLNEERLRRAIAKAECR